MISWLPSAEKEADRTEPLIFNVATHCLDLSDTNGTWPWSPRNAISPGSVDEKQDGGDTANVSRLFMLQPEVPAMRSTFPAVTS